MGGRAGSARRGTEGGRQRATHVILVVGHIDWSAKQRDVWNGCEECVDDGTEAAGGVGLRRFGVCGCCGKLAKCQPGTLGWRVMDGGRSATQKHAGDTVIRWGCQSWRSTCFSSALEGSHQGHFSIARLTQMHLVPVSPRRDFSRLGRPCALSTGHLSKRVYCHVHRFLWRQPLGTLPAPMTTHPTSLAWATSSAALSRWAAGGPRHWNRRQPGTLRLQRYAEGMGNKEAGNARQ